MCLDQSGLCTKLVGLLSGMKAFFDGVPYNVSYDDTWFGLPDAVDTPDGLVLDGGR